MAAASVKAVVVALMTARSVDERRAYLEQWIEDVPAEQQIGRLGEVIAWAVSYIDILRAQDGFDALFDAYLQELGRKAANEGDGS